jgi:hypothetical protein
MDNSPRIAKTVDGDSVSLELRPLLLSVYTELAQRPVHPGTLRIRLEALFEFLATAAGRTRANCWATDVFFGHQEGWGEVTWDSAPRAVQHILADIGRSLHNTVDEPHLAQGARATPELLLQRLRDTEF